MDTSEYYSNLDKSPMYKKAQRRVRAIRRFYKFLGTYILVSIFLSALNLFTWGGDFWAIFPILGMGLGVGLNYIRLFGIPFVGPMDEEWEERKLREEVMKMDNDRFHDEWEAKQKNYNSQNFDLNQDIELKDLDYENLEKDFKEKFK